jgi:ATP/maltotriose-dependent transcriptional regulator MalT
VGSRYVATSKLSAPPIRPGIVDRPSLVDRLVSTSFAPLGLCSAPAGYGKTTRLSLWPERDERWFAWMTVDAADNDPVAFTAAVVRALSPIVTLDEPVRDAVNAPEPPLEDVVLPALVDAVIDARRPFVLVLDDVHLVTERRCYKLLAYLAERLPVGSQLALATRSDPPPSLGSLRPHGRRVELRADELSPAPGEARDLLAAAGVSLSDDRLARVVERTEGWPAAIYLAALSLRERTDAEDFVDAFAGASRHVAEFLSEDVLARTWEGRLPDGTSSLETALAILTSAFGLDGVSRMQKVAQRAVHLEPTTSRHRAIATELLGIALTLNGEFAPARSFLAEATRLAGDRLSTAAMSVAHLAVIGLREGDDDAAFRYAERAHALVETPRMRADLAAVATYSVFAHVLARRGDLEKAGSAVERATERFPQLTESFWWLMIETRILLAPVLAELGREGEAITRLKEAEALLFAHEDAAQLPLWYDDACRRLDGAKVRRRGPASPELTAAELRIRRLLATDLTLREIGRELCLSLNTVKTHTRAIYRKLGVGSRSDAIQSAVTASRSGGRGSRSRRSAAR